MSDLIDKINQVEFSIDGEALLYVLNTIHQLVAVYLTEEERTLLRYDLNHFYYEKGRHFVHNTFAGGIIFLREPEIINKIEIQFRSDLNEATATVEYASEIRNARNVKYKPTAGKFESQKWSMELIFPNFARHRKDVKIVLMVIKGKITKKICESYKKDSWFMQYENPFYIWLLLDDGLELIYNVEIE